jgi:hypothetical protein
MLKLESDSAQILATLIIKTIPRRTRHTCPARLPVQAGERVLTHGGAQESIDCHSAHVVDALATFDVVLNTMDARNVRAPITNSFTSP